MSTHRQRMLDALDYNRPDRIPVVYHPSPAGLYVHGQKLLDLFNTYPPDNPASFDSLPVPPPGTVDESGRYCEIKADEWGTVREYRIFGVQGYPKQYPFATWEAAADYIFPPLPEIDSAVVAAQRTEYLVFSGWVSILEKLHGLRPLDEVLMDLVTHDRHLLAFLDRLVDYWQPAIADLIQAGVDVIVFGDDWGIQTATMVSPDLFRSLFRPYYERLMDPIHKAGRRILFHSCGYLADGYIRGEILDQLLDLGIDILWPQITLCEAIPGFVEKCREHRTSIYIHPDRQRLVPLGTPQEIESAVHQYADRYHRLGGGGIFYIEMENDAPFENVQALVEAVHRYR